MKPFAELRILELAGSPAGAFAYNTILCNLKKTQRAHKPGWDVQATSRSHVFRRDY